MEYTGYERDTLALFYLQFFGLGVGDRFGCLSA